MSEDDGRTVGGNAWARRGYCSDKRSMCKPMRIDYGATRILCGASGILRINIYTSRDIYCGIIRIVQVAGIACAPPTAVIRRFNGGKVHTSENVSRVLSHNLQGRVHRSLQSPMIGPLSRRHATANRRRLENAVLASCNSFKTFRKISQML